MQEHEDGFCAIAVVRAQTAHSVTPFPVTHFTIFAQEKPIMSKSSQAAFEPGKYGTRVQKKARDSSRIDRNLRHANQPHPRDSRERR
jgi:hypothetical protein